MQNQRALEMGISPIISTVLIVYSDWPQEKRFEVAIASAVAISERNSVEKK